MNYDLELDDRSEVVAQEILGDTTFSWVDLEEPTNIFNDGFMPETGGVEWWSN